jgi:transposase
MIPLRSFLKGLRERVGDVGCGDDREDQAGVFHRQEVDQADLPRAAGVAEHGAQGDPVGRDGVHLRAHACSRARRSALADELDEMLAENARRPKRERLTLVRIFEELRNLGYDGGYDAVRRYAASWSKAMREASAAAYVPLSFDPGEAYQFDWSHEIVS